MGDLFHIALICVAVMVGAIALTQLESAPPSACERLIGGWHPDVPTAVAEECRAVMRSYRASLTSLGY